MAGKGPKSFRVVKYNNELNGIGLKNWTKEDLNFFFAIIAEARDKGTAELYFTIDHLIEVTGYTKANNKRTNDFLWELCNKASTLRWIEYMKRIIPLFSLFETDVDENENVIGIKVELSKHYEYILNQLTANFTSFELEEFLKLKSIYSKQLYRHLKQWRTVGAKEFKIEEFREILNIPESYTLGDINKRVMKPILNELPRAFQNLTVETTKADRRGQPVTGYIFEWSPEKTGKWQEDKPYTIDYNLRKERRRKGKKKTELPDWYSDTGHELDPNNPEDQALIAAALAQQQSLSSDADLEDEQVKKSE